MIEVNKDGGVAVVTMNRPAQRNAMSADLVEALIAACLDLDADEPVRAIVLTGAGAGFCAGSDLTGLARMSPAERSAFEAESGRAARLFGSLSKPVVAAVRGFAIGGGLTLATACDVVVTEASAKWSLPETPIGLFPAWGLASVVERVGKTWARRLSFGIDTLTGVEACRIGLADQVAEGDVLAEALGVARKLAALPPASAAAAKDYFFTDPRGQEADELANRLFMRTTTTPEAQASFAKFAAKGG